MTVYTSDVSEARNLSEQKFFDEHFKKTTPSLNGFYNVSHARRRFGDLVYRDCAGLRVLEYGCGPSGYAFGLAERGATVTGIDISNTAIAMARERANGFPDGSLTFRLGDAEKLDFPPASFDMVCGTSILHHLDIARAAAEIRRVLKPGGRAVFYEPVGHNPVVNLYRKFTPHLHTPDEHPLVADDFRLLRQLFSEVRTEFYDLLALGAIPLLRLPGGVPLLRTFEAVDRVVLKVPGIRRWGSVVVIEMKS